MKGNLARSEYRLAVRTRDMFRVPICDPQLLLTIDNEGRRDRLRR